MRRHLRVLVTIASSGADPFLEIEEEGQAKTFGSIPQDGFGLLWFQGIPALNKNLGFFLLEKLLARIHRDSYSDRPTVEFILLNWRIQIRRKPIRIHSGEYVRSFNILRVRLNWSRFFGSDAKWALPYRVLSRLLWTIYERATSFGESGWGSRVIHRLPSSYFLHPLRTLERLRYSLDHYYFDYVLLTTSTCYVDFLKLSNTVDALPESGCYAGAKLKLSLNSISGNSILLSRDVVGRILEFASEFRFDLADDVAIGKLISDHNIAPLIDIPTIDLPHDFLTNNKLPEDRDNGYLFRCKMEDKTERANLVVAAMKQLHRLLEV